MARKSRKSYVTSVKEQSTIIEYSVAIYVRLSVEDIRKKNSDSIGTQKNMLLNYVSTNADFKLFDIYEDVNYTGTNFERPAFNRMMDDIRAGKVDCVVVKDLSRFGRNFTEAGHYLERVFPFLNVRFISLNDCYDSLTSSSDDTNLVVPLKNLMNEVYARDVSKKSQSSYKIKQKNGDFCGSFAPYGYIKNGDSLVIDHETAPIVRKIFGWIAEGKSDIAIAGELNNLGILPPSKYRFDKGITKAKKHENTKFWYKSAIKRISENPTYTGIIAGGRYQSNFLKGGGRIEIGIKDWIITENAHDPIVDKGIFEQVQKIRHNRKEVYNSKIKVNAELVPNIYKGIIFCGECASNMMRHKVKRASGVIEYFFLCNVYEQVDKNACSKKYVSETELNGILFNAISRQIELAVSINKIIEKLERQYSFHKQNSTFESDMNEIKKKISKVKRFMLSLREDHCDGIVSDEEYVSIKKDYENELSELHDKRDEIQTEKYAQDKSLSGNNVWINEFTRFESEQQVNYEMVSALVEKIEINSDNHISISFNYRDEFEKIYAYIGSYERSAVNE